MEHVIAIGGLIVAFVVYALFVKPRVGCGSCGTDGKESGGTCGKCRH